MAQARYTVLAPTVPGLSEAISRYLTEGPIPVKALNVLAGDPYTQVIAWAEETPEIDSHFKQIGTYVGEAANAPVISVVREGKSGVSTWEMKNKHYVPQSTHEELSRDLDRDPGGRGFEDEPDQGTMPPMATDVSPVGHDSDEGSHSFDTEVNDVATGDHSPHSEAERTPSPFH